MVSAARAAVARHRAGFSREQGRYEIEIPLEALEVASTALDASVCASNWRRRSPLAAVGGVPACLAEGYGKGRCEVMAAKRCGP